MRCVVCRSVRPSNPSAEGYAGLQCIGGILAEEAVQLLRDFYLSGNPKGGCRPAHNLQLQFPTDLCWTEAMDETAELNHSQQRSAAEDVIYSPS